MEKENIENTPAIIKSKNVFLKPTRRNLKKMNDELQSLVSDWDYEQSTGSMQKIVYKWKNLTVEVMRGLFEAHYVLTELGKEKRDTNLKEGKESPNVKNLTFGKTWGDYCDEVGISRQTAHNWLKRFVPREKSATGLDILLTPEELKMIEAENEELKEAQVNKLVNEYEITKVRGARWNEDCEQELQRRLSMKRVTDDVEAMVAAWSTKSKYSQLDFFQEWQESMAVEDIRLPDPRLNEYQFRYFKSADSYLDSFDDIDQRAQAASNLIKKIKIKINEDFYHIQAVQERKDDDED